MILTVANDSIKEKISWSIKLTSLTAAKPKTDSKTAKNTKANAKASAAAKASIKGVRTVTFVL